MRPFFPLAGLFLVVLLACGQVTRVLHQHGDGDGDGPATAKTEEKKEETKPPDAEVVIAVPERKRQVDFRALCKKVVTKDPAVKPETRNMLSELLDISKQTGITKKENPTSKEKEYGSFSEEECEKARQTLFGKTALSLTVEAPMDLSVLLLLEQIDNLFIKASDPKFLIGLSDTLAKMSQLESLKLEETDFRDLEKLIALKKLQILVIKNKLEAVVEPLDLAPLRLYPALSDLELYAFPVLSLAPLQHAAHLKHLTLDVRAPVDLQSIRPLTQLRLLSLSYKLKDGEYPEVDFKPIGSLYQLEELHIRLSSVKELDFLQGLSDSLKTLSLHRSPYLVDVSPISWLRKLQSLRLSKCNLVTDIKKLQDHLPSLKSLFLENSGVTDLTTAAAFPNLEELSIPEGAPLEPLARMQHLTTLWMLNTPETWDPNLLIPIKNLKTVYFSYKPRPKKKDPEEKEKPLPEFPSSGLTAIPHVKFIPATDDFVRQASVWRKEE